MKRLECGCCGESFKGRQHWNWDTGYGRCLKCCAWILSTPRWEDDHAMIKAGMAEQWPDSYPDDFGMYAEDTDKGIALIRDARRA